MAERPFVGHASRDHWLAITIAQPLGLGILAFFVVSGSFDDVRINVISLGMLSARRTRQGDISYCESMHDVTLDSHRDAIVNSTG